METERLLDVALFAHKSDNQPRQRHVDWPSLVKVLTSHEERTNKDGRLWSPTLYKPETKRAKQNVISVSALVLDFDRGDNPEAFTWGWDRWCWVMHTTHSHTPEAPRWRVVFPLVEPVAGAEWPAVWSALAHRFGGNEVDPSCKDASRIYYLPSCPPGAARLVHENAGDWLDAGEFLRPSVELLVERARGELHTGRNNAGMWLACQLRDNAYSQAEAERADWHTQVATEKQRPDGKVDRYTEHEWRETVRKVYGTPARPGWTALRNGANGTGNEGGYVASVAYLTPKRKRREPPELLEREALHGLPGDVVRAIEPHTESHPVAVLGSFIAGAGALFGRGPHVYRDGARHAVNEFVCLVGRSAVGRKGTATRRTDEVFLDCIGSNYTKTYYMRGTEEERGPTWEDYLLRGLGSGEALVEALAEDESSGGRKILFDEEFSNALKVMRRDGSTLSDILRKGWDGGALGHRVRGRRLLATDYHLSILTHTTEADLKDQLKAREVFNGFANRFLWLATKRVKYLPFGGGDAPIAPVVHHLHEVLEMSRTVGRVEFDEEVSELWDRGGLYQMLTERPENFFGVVTSRAESHVTRLALFWALTDGLKTIHMPHLLAALALWEFNEQTCRWLFGESSGDEYADIITELLEEVYPGYLTRTQIRDHFKRHAPAGRIPAALELLEHQGRAERQVIPTEGRPSECWLACQKSDRSDKSPLAYAREWVRERE